MGKKFFDNMYDAAKYYTELVRKECKVTEDLKNLIQAYLVMAWVCEELKKKKKCEKIHDKLRPKCIQISCYLWEKVIREQEGRGN